MRTPTTLRPPSELRRAALARGPAYLRKFLCRQLVCAAAAALAVFHGVLLWERISSLTLLEPAVALRWATGLLLLLSLVRLRQAKGSLVRSREALVVWTLIAVLHAGVVPAGDAWAATLAEAEAGLWLALPLALATVLAWAAGTAGVAPTLPSPASYRRFGPPPRHFLRAACPEILSPRPPPGV